MARFYLLRQDLGWPFDKIREGSFLQLPSKRRRQVNAQPKVLFLLGGACRVILGQGLQADWEEGDIFINPLLEPYQYQSLPGLKAQTIYTFGILFEPAVLGRRAQPDPHRRGIQNLLREVLGRPQFLKHAITQSMHDLLRELRLEMETPQAASPAYLHALSLQLLVLVLRALDASPNAPSRPPARAATALVGQVREFVTKSIDTNLTLEQIALHLNLSAEHLARTFKAQTGMTVMQTVRDHKIDAAKTRLLGSNNSIEKIARRLGFDNPSRFHRIFRQRTGLTPLAYRASFGANAPFRRRSDKTQKGSVMNGTG